MRPIALSVTSINVGSQSGKCHAGRQKGERRETRLGGEPTGRTELMKKKRGQGALRGQGS